VQPIGTMQGLQFIPGSNITSYARIAESNESGSDFDSSSSGSDKSNSSSDGSCHRKITEENKSNFLSVPTCSKMPK